MKNDSEILWKGKPNYVFRIKLLDQESYYDVVMGFSSKLVIYVICMVSVVYAIVTIATIDVNNWIYGFILITGMIIPDIIAWFILKRKIYILTNTHVNVYSEENILEIKIPITDISNIYSLNENKKMETIVITYKNYNSDKLMKQKLMNIFKSDQFQEKCAKLKL